MYRGIAKDLIDKAGAKEGDLIELKHKDGTHKGVLMPRLELADDKHIVLKLDNGYNIGILVDKSVSVKKLESPPKKEKKKSKLAAKKELPNIQMLGVGGTISSRVDYRTGGVISIVTEEELMETVPELSEIANIKCEQIASMFSEDMQPEHYTRIAEKVKEAVDSGVDGVIITHGTDTMHYTSSALSFMLDNLPVPVVITGSQRSSDRGSSDAAMNLICSAIFASQADCAGVFVCMHGTPGDDKCLVHKGVKVRKLHTSRRDTFRSVNVSPVAEVFFSDRKISILSKDIPKRDRKRKVKLESEMEPKVALLKIHPGIKPELIDFFVNQGYKGLVLEGTGLGHAPINETDEYTKRNAQIRKKIADASEKMAVVMTSQCIFGSVDMNVYSTGRDLLNMGVISGGDMLPEVAYTKLMWALGNHPKEARKLMGADLRGEHAGRREVTDFPPEA
jgi:glutamyl-tRNA(Gln) amidotransferase subunit D